MKMKLLEFNIKRPCKKCGYKGKIFKDLMVYRPAAEVAYMVDEDYLLRTCKRCGYKWGEACTDNE